MCFKQSNEHPPVYEKFYTFYRRKYCALRRRICDATRSGRGPEGVKSALDSSLRGLGLFFPKGVGATRRSWCFWGHHSGL